MAFAFTAFVALVWLNQSIGGAEWDALRDRHEAHQTSTWEELRYPLLFLYRRSGDEEIYFATASAVVGAPFDQAALDRRGPTPLPPITTPADGHFHVPYRDVPFEYPPVNVPFVVLPRLLTSSFRVYGVLFSALMGSLLVASAWIGARLGGRDDDTVAERMGIAGLLLLTHGSIAVQRLDAVIAFLLALALHAGARRRFGGLGFWMGLAGAAKLVPILLLPAAAVAAGARTRSSLLRAALGGLAGLVLGLGPMLVLSPSAFPMLLAYHGKRGLHVESSLGVLYGLLHVVTGSHEVATISYGSYNFSGAVADALARLCTPLALALVALVTVVVVRGVRKAPAEDTVHDGLALTLLAGCVALWLGGKVFSPQYLTWGLPLALAIPGRRGLETCVAFGVALFLGQLYLRGFYDHVYNQWPLGVATMVVRLALLVGWFVVLVRALGRPSCATSAVTSGVARA